MAEHIRRARDAVQRASEATRANIGEQLLSVDEGLMELEEGDKTSSETVPDRDRIEEVEEKVVGMADRTDDAEARRHLEEARDHLDRYRRARGIPAERGEDGSEVEIDGEDADGGSDREGAKSGPGGADRE